MSASPITDELGLRIQCPECLKLRTVSERWRVQRVCGSFLTQDQLVTIALGTGQDPDDLCSECLVISMGEAS